MPPGIGGRAALNGSGLGGLCYGPVVDAEPVGRYAPDKNACSVWGFSLLGVGAVRRESDEGRMRFVSLNLDVGDAAVLRCVVQRVVTACPCRALGRPARCHECEVIESVLADLNSVLDRSTGESRVAGPLRGAAAPHQAALPETTYGAGPEATRRLRVVPGGLVDASR